ncbi:MAG: hypothetical protein MJA28_06285 [Gammaproteobacteria bacterium]|nr:hypothetical protein [Gammaproteobacteria bacterium]
MDNETRAESARNAVQIHASEKGAGNEPLCSQMADLVADLMHLCMHEEIDFNEIVETSSMHFEVEAC